MTEVRARRVYEAPEAADGTRVLVDRLWPRGLAKEAAHVDEWLKAVAPSNELRRWYGHDQARFADFCQRYADELREPEPAAALLHLREAAARGTVTLLTATKDLGHSQAAYLAGRLRAYAREASAAGDEAGGDPACWLPLACPRCGAITGENGQPGRCPHCG